MPPIALAVPPPRLRPLLIVLSHLRWDFVVQRPQHLLSRAAADFDVIFLEEPVWEGDVAGMRDMWRDTGAGYGITVMQPLLPVGTRPAAALAHQADIAASLAARAGTGPLYLWYYTPMALAFTRALAADLVILDKMDELAAFAFAPPELAVLEAELLANADLVFTGGASLQAAALRKRADAHCFPSSIDTAHFGSARRGDLADPASQRDLARPRIGFFGVIDERMDLALVAAVAALQPAWQLVMIGPIAKIDPASLPRAANIHWLGARPYADLPAYLAYWDIAWMPFALNAATRHISPTKTPEFLAAGLPVISTAIPDVVTGHGKSGLVEIALDAADVVACAAEMLALNANPARRAQRLAVVDRHLAGTSWDLTWAAMQALISNAAAPALASARSAHV
ncbi:MAG: glycosyltransferase [Sphingomonadales bacterium]|jgi:hypothetical protein